MSKEDKKVVVRRKGGGHAGGHHGGGWKIAYADFMTAMMAFFLVMWLLSISSPKQREGIAEHFRMPLKVALSGGEKVAMSQSVVPGGGTDLAHSDGDVKRAADEDDADATRLDAMKTKLEAMIDNSPSIKALRSQILIDITTEGLRLQIVDSDKRPMFDLASARVLPYMRTILRELGPMLNELPNKITVSGHTDAIVYTNDGSYSNWELSADRANASRRELLVGGMAGEKVLRVVGLADSAHLDRANPRNPVNRRISIIVLNHQTQERFERENTGEATMALPARRAPGQPS